MQLQIFIIVLGHFLMWVFNSPNGVWDKFEADPEVDTKSNFFRWFKWVINAAFLANMIYSIWFAIGLFVD